MGSLLIGGFEGTGEFARWSSTNAEMGGADFEFVTRDPEEAYVGEAYQGTDAGA